MIATYYFTISAVLFIIFYCSMTKLQKIISVRKKLAFIHNQKLDDKSDSEYKRATSNFAGKTTTFIKTPSYIKFQAHLSRRHNIVICFAIAVSVFIFIACFSLVKFFQISLNAYNLLYTSTLCCVLAYSIKLYICRQSTNRLKKVSAAFPDVLELLSICTGAGLSMDASIHRLSEDLKIIYPEISKELATLSSEINMFPNKKAAYQNFSARTKIPHVDNIFASVLQAEQVGSSLSLLFKSYTDSIRKQRILAIEEKSARLPTLLTIPMIIFILPVLFIVLLGPAVLSVSDNLFSH